MKKFVFLISVIFLFVSSSFAIFKIGVDGGYTSVAMGKLNSEIEDIGNSVSGANVTKFGGGVYGDLKIELGFLPFLSIGPKVGVIYAFPAKVEYTDTSTNTTAKINYNALLIPIEGGISASVGLPGIPFSVFGGIYGGYGIALLTSGMEINGVRADYPYDGGGFVADIKAGAEFSLAPFISGAINLGYRIANIKEIKASSDVELGGITVVKKGDVLEDSDGNSVPVDFSGFIAGVGLNIGF